MSQGKNAGWADNAGQEHPSQALQEDVQGYSGPASDELFVAHRALPVFIGDQDARSRSGDSNHIINGGFFIIEEIDSSYVNHAVKSFRLELKLFAVSELP